MMAGFEIIVRPVVFPNIRPTPARSLPPPDDPEKGFATIKGNGAKLVSLTTSFSKNMSKSRSVETKRRVDVARVYQKKKDGTINKENFVDVEVANKIWKKEGKKPAGGGYIPGTDMPPSSGDVTEERSIAFYKRVEKADNIEIKKKDEIKKNPDANE